uniref:NADH-ubiquinone oxidoreductase chain 4 n=1 Tax=Paduniella communis TaxID=2904892 RepID=A0A9E8LP57_9NEOP|nr:NADH dehydrogenase subunit 4 [Paduniella communis]UZZ44255.1 NADH dehydrogenase subunit 4 [Paduniella communis]
MLKFIFFFFFFFFFSNYWFLFMLVFLLIYLLLMNFNIFNFFNLSMMFSMDILSMGLMILSLWIILLMVMSTDLIYYKNLNVKFYLFNLLFMLGLLFMVFLSMNIFIFYLLFEISLIPVLLLIMGWGYQVDRVQAGIYLLFYTLFLSLPMLIGIVYLYFSFNCMIMYLINNVDNMILYLIFTMSFLVKMPMFLFHLWLLKAHVESPVSGSMILAGIMLKLGGYGLIRTMNFYLLNSLNLNFFFIIFSLIGGVYLALVCLLQIDMKLLIAMSSIVHMSMVIGGIMSLNFFGMMGSYVLMLGHGLCSSGMFLLANILYERLLSRSMLLNKGLINLFPLLSFWWFLMISSNMASPPSLNLLGEISLMIAIISYSKYFLFILFSLNFFSAVYNLYLYSFTQHGKLLDNLLSFNMIMSREYLVLLLHWLPLNILFFSFDFIFLMS